MKITNAAMGDIVTQAFMSLVNRLESTKGASEPRSIVADIVLNSDYMDLTETKNYVLPLAGSVPEGTRRVLRHPDWCSKTTQPVIKSVGGDLISYSGGVDTEIVLDQDYSIEVVLTSDGINRWRL